MYKIFALCVVLASALGAPAPEPDEAILTPALKVGVPYYNPAILPAAQLAYTYPAYPYASYPGYHGYPAYTGYPGAYPAVVYTKVI